jgi:hypothetical protein
VIVLGGLELVELVLLLGHWALCYMLLLEALPALLATWQGEPSDGGTRSASGEEGQQQSWLAKLAGALLGSAPAGLLGLGRWTEFR